MTLMQRNRTTDTQDRIDQIVDSLDNCHPGVIARALLPLKLTGDQIKARIKRCGYILTETEDVRDTGWWLDHPDDEFLDRRGTPFTTRFDAMCAAISVQQNVAHSAWIETEKG